MGKWSPLAKERARMRNAQKREVKLEECADAVRNILSAAERPMAKDEVAKLVPQEIEAMRHSGGTHYIPTVENSPVRIAKSSFVVNNWGEINILNARENRFYYRYCTEGWETCSLEKWDEFIGVRRTIVNGSIESYNEAAELLQKRGRQTPTLTHAELPAPQRQ